MRRGKLPQPLRDFARCSNYSLIVTTRAINQILVMNGMFCVTRQAVRRWMHQ